MQNRGKGDFSAQQKTVDEIIGNILKDGDAALFAAIRKFDGYQADAQNILVTQEEIDAAYASVDKKFLDIMKRSAKNIFDFHERQVRKDWFIEQEGKKVGQVYRPVEYAGVYVPGGKAAYPSSVLMNIIPAKCAGVPNIFVATPAQNGVINPATLIAAREAGRTAFIKWAARRRLPRLHMGQKPFPR